MRFVFLGTSSATPTTTRNVTGLGVNRQNDKEWLLIDCGEGTQHQILRTDYSLQHLAVIFITHVHGDHCYGLPGLLTTAALQGRTAPLTIVAPDALRNFLDTTFSATAAHLSYDIEFIDVESLNDPIDVLGFSIARIPLSHRVPSFAFRLEERDLPRVLDTKKLRALGSEPGPDWRRLQSRENVTLADGTSILASDVMVAGHDARVVVIGGDNDKPELLADACANARLLVHESTYTEAAVAGKEGAQHSSALRVASFAESVAGLSNLILTHFSPRYQSDPARSPSIEDIRREARDAYTGTLHLASDLAVYVLDRQGDLHESVIQGNHFLAGEEK